MFLVMLRDPSRHPRSFAAGVVPGFPKLRLSTVSPVFVRIVTPLSRLNYSCSISNGFRACLPVAGYAQNNNTLNRRAGFTPSGSTFCVRRSCFTQIIDFPSACPVLQPRRGPPDHFNRTRRRSRG